MSIDASAKSAFKMTIDDVVKSICEDAAVVELVDDHKNRLNEYIIKKFRREELNGDDCLIYSEAIDYNQNGQVHQGVGILVYHGGQFLQLILNIRNHNLEAARVVAMDVGLKLATISKSIWMNCDGVTALETKKIHFMTNYVEFVKHYEENIKNINDEESYDGYPTKQFMKRTKDLVNARFTVSKSLPDCQIHAYMHVLAKIGTYNNRYLEDSTIADKIIDNLDINNNKWSNPNTTVPNVKDIDYSNIEQLQEIAQQVNQNARLVKLPRKRRRKLAQFVKAITTSQREKGVCLICGDGSKLKKKSGVGIVLVKGKRTVLLAIQIKASGSPQAEYEALHIGLRLASYAELTIIKTDQLDLVKNVTKELEEMNRMKNNQAEVEAAFICLFFLLKESQFEKKNIIYLLEKIEELNEKLEKLNKKFAKNYKRKFLEELTKHKKVEFIYAQSHAGRNLHSVADLLAEIGAHGNMESSIAKYKFLTGGIVTAKWDKEEFEKKQKPVALNGVLDSKESGEDKENVADKETRKDNLEEQDQELANWFF